MKIYLNVKRKTPYNRKLYTNYKINITNTDNENLRNIIKIYFKYSEYREQYPRDWLLEVGGKNISTGSSAILKGFQLRILKILKEEQIANKYIEDKDEYYKNVESTIALFPLYGYETIENGKTRNSWYKYLDVDYLNLVGVNNGYKINTTKNKIYLGLKLGNICETGYTYYTFNITDATTKDIDSIIKKFFRIGVKSPYKRNIWMLNVVTGLGEIYTKHKLFEHTKSEIHYFLDKYDVDHFFRYNWVKKYNNEDEIYAFDLKEYQDFKLPYAETLIRQRYQEDISL